MSELAIYTATEVATLLGCTPERVEEMAAHISRKKKGDSDAQSHD